MPAAVLKPGRNEITVLELHATTAPTVRLLGAPACGGTEE
ncbi:hypothetical protein QBC98_002637 [Kitasatospora acidiphila]